MRPTQSGDVFGESGAVGLTDMQRLIEEWRSLLVIQDHADLSRALELQVPLQLVEKPLGGGGGLRGFDF